MSDLITQRVVAFASAARTATDTSAQITLPSSAQSIAIAMETTAYSTGTFTAKIQHSLDGAQWEDVTGATTGAIGATGLKTGAASIPVLPLVRVVLTGASTPSATQRVFIVYR